MSKCWLSCNRNRMLWIGKMYQRFLFDRVRTSAWCAKLTFTIETIYSAYSACLVWATQQVYTMWIFQLVSQQKAYYLYRPKASADVVSQEQIFGVRWVSQKLKYPQEIVKLSVKVSCKRMTNHSLHTRLSEFGQTKSAFSPNDFLTLNLGMKRVIRLPPPSTHMYTNTAVN